LLVEEGELGLIDPFLQTQALLAKLMVRCLAPGEEPWKSLLRYKIEQGRPLEDAKWHRAHTWLLFSKGLKRENHSSLVTAKY